MHIAVVSAFTVSRLLQGPPGKNLHSNGGGGPFKKLSGVEEMTGEKKEFQIAVVGSLNFILMSKKRPFGNISSQLQLHHNLVCNDLPKPKHMQGTIYSFIHTQLFPARQVVLFLGTGLNLPFLNGKRCGAAFYLQGHENNKNRNGGSV